MDPLFDLSGKVVVVTGGLGRLGRRFARALLDRGARVAAFDTAAGTGGGAFPGAPADQFLAVPADVTRKDSVAKALDEVRARWGVPDALVNNAAIDAPPDASAAVNGPFESYAEEAWTQVLDVNLKGGFLCSQAVGGAMASQGRGAIVNVGSIYGAVSPDQRIYEHRRVRGEPFYKPAAYTASKSALVGLTRWLATYWAPRGIRVNLLTLGGVRAGQDPEFVKGYEARVPLGRMAREEEYDGAIVFLLSEASAYMTGANLVVDGGWTAW